MQFQVNHPALFAITCAVILLVFHFGGVFDTIETVLIWLALALTVISLINYLYINRNVLEEVH